MDAKKQVVPPKKKKTASGRSVYLSDETWEALEREAKKGGYSLSGYLNTLVQLGLGLLKSGSNA